MQPNVILYWTLSLFLVVAGCKTKGQKDNSGSMLAINTGEELSCPSDRTKPLVAFSLWRAVTKNGVTCDPKFNESFLPDVNKIYKPKVIGYYEFVDFYPRTQTGKWMEDNIASAMDEAVASNPRCPMILFNVTCFEMDRAFQNGCGSKFNPENSGCVTAYEVNRILSNETLFAATIWYELRGESYKVLSPAEVQTKFEKYFPEHWN